MSRTHHSVSILLISAPDVDLAVLGEVAHSPDGEIDRAIDLAEPGTAVAELRCIDDIEEFQRGRGHAAVTVAFAQRELDHLVVETALHAEPFVAQPAAGEGKCGKRNGSADRWISSADAGVLAPQPQVGRPEPGQAARDDARTPCVRID
jgi:hypothetical protein